MEKESTKKATPEAPDPEMLKNLDLLLSMDALENEENWDEIEIVDDSKSEDPL